MLIQRTYTYRSIHKQTTPETVKRQISTFCLGYFTNVQNLNKHLNGFTVTA